MSTATVGLLSSAAKVTATRTTASINASSSSTSCCCGAPFIAAVSLSSYKFTTILTTSRKLRLTCEVTSDSKSSSSSSSSVLLASSDDDDDDESAVSKIGAKIKVKVPLKVYHVPKVPEIDLTGMVGELKQYAGLWKGKRISANLPFKVEFVIDVQGRGPLKFFAHLKRDEFDYLSD